MEYPLNYLPYLVCAPDDHKIADKGGCFDTENEKYAWPALRSHSPPPKASPIAPVSLFPWYQKICRTANLWFHSMLLKGITVSY